MKRYLSGVLLALFCSVVMVVNAGDCADHGARSVCKARIGL
jgi:hypothetical protein